MANGRIPKTDDEITDFLMCTLAKDFEVYYSKDFERQIQDVFDQVSTNQLQDTIQHQFWEFVHSPFVAY